MRSVARWSEAASERENGGRFFGTSQWDESESCFGYRVEETPDWVLMTQTTLTGGK